MGKAKDTAAGSEDAGKRRPPREHPPLTPTEAVAHRALSRRTVELRKAKGWSQNKLADFSGIARGYLSHILAGEYSPTVRILARLADALEVQVKDLFV